MAGYPVQTYWLLVPSSLTEPVEITTSPTLVPFESAPVVPTRINVSAPTLSSSSTTIAAAGPPIPVDVHETGEPLNFPVYVMNSRCCATFLLELHWEAIFWTLSGSPGRRTYLATSPGPHEIRSEEHTSEL